MTPAADLVDWVTFEVVVLNPLETEDDVLTDLLNAA
jgi:hypothetical protein